MITKCWSRVLLPFAAAALSGCFLFHRESPQQKMLDALNRGNAAQASQIWHQMSQKDRMKFNRGEGLHPAVPPKEAAKMLSQMPPGDMPSEITITPPNQGGSLMDLPKMINAQPAAPPQPANPPGELNEQP
jgi:hypothetical protein